MADLLRVATLVVGDEATGWRRRRAYCAAVLAEQAADLIALQRLTRRSSEQLAVQLSQMTGTDYHRLHARGGQAGGVALLSRWPFLGGDTYRLQPAAGIALVGAILTGHAAALTLVSLQLADLPRQQDVRRLQLMYLLNRLYAQTGSLVLAGGFASAPQEPALEAAQKVYRLKSAAVAATGFELVATAPTLAAPQTGLARCEDYLLVSHRLHVTEMSVFANRPDPADEQLFPATHIGLCATLHL